MRSPEGSPHPQPNPASAEATPNVRLAAADGELVKGFAAEQAAATSPENNAEQISTIIGELRSQMEGMQAKLDQLEQMYTRAQANQEGAVTDPAEASSTSSSTESNQPSGELQSALDKVEGISGTLSQKLNTEKQAEANDEQPSTGNSQGAVINNAPAGEAATGTPSTAEAANIVTPEAGWGLSAEQARQVNEKINDIQRVWNDAPSIVRNGHSIDLRPLINDNGDVRKYAQELQKNIAEGNYQYGYLKVGGEMTDADRFDKLMEELGQLKGTIEREVLSNPQTSQELNELDDALEKGMDDFYNKLNNSSGAVKRMARTDPGIQRRLRGMKKKPSVFRKILELL